MANSDYDIISQQDNDSSALNIANFRHCKMVDPLITYIVSKNQESQEPKTAKSRKNQILMTS